MGYFAPNAFRTFVQCGRGNAVNDSPFTYTNDSGVYEIVNSVTVPVGTGANGATFYTSSGNWHMAEGIPFDMYLTVNSIDGLRSNNTIRVSNQVQDNGAGKPDFSYLQNQTFTFSGLQVPPYSTVEFYIPFVDNYPQGCIYCTNNNGITGSITQQVHTVTYNANGGSGAPASQQKIWGSILTLSSTIPTRTGYEFLYWNTSSDGSGRTYNPGDLYGEDADITLYAIWRQRPRYTVTFNANGGTNAPASQSKLEGDALTLTSSKPSKSYTVTYHPNGGSVSPTSKIVSCTFVSWNTKADGSGTSYASGSQYTADANVTLYAIWRNNTIGTLPTPTRANCQFHMWTTTLNGSNQVTSSYTVTRNITIYAKWKYAVVFNANGGILAITSGTTVTQQTTATLYKTHGVSLTIPTNYICYMTDSSTGSGSQDDPGGNYTPSTSTQFSGWGTSSSTQTVSYKPGSSYISDNPTTLYAVYDINRYTVIFTDGYSGTVLKQYDNVPQGTGVTPPPDPVREGFTFSGWLGDYSCIMSNTTIEAFWGFTPIWIRHNGVWIKYEPEED